MASEGWEEGAVMWCWIRVVGRDGHEYRCNDGKAMWIDTV